METKTIPASILVLLCFLVYFLNNNHQENEEKATYSFFSGYLALLCVLFYKEHQMV